MAQTSRQFRTDRRAGWRLLVLASSILLVSTAPSLLAGIMSFRGLGDLAGGDFRSWAFGVSADGSTVVGSSSAAMGTEAFQWTLSEGMVGLGDISDDRFSSTAAAVSGDGGKVVGRADGGAVRWMPDGEIISLGHLHNEYTSGSSSDISGDGTVIVGSSLIARGRNVDRYEAFRWSAVEGMVGLGDLSGDSVNSRAYAISFDGSMIVGYGNIEGLREGEGQAFYWTADEGMIALGGAPDGTIKSIAWDVSSDGAVIVGSFRKEEVDEQAFRWTAETGLVSLGEFTGGSSRTIANAVSGDGAVIVGEARVQSSPQRIDEAFIWDSVHGMRSLHDLLSDDFDLGLEGWTLRSATDISADGNTIVGYGINPDGHREAWIAVIPEPATFSLVLIGTVFLAGRPRLTSAHP